MKTFRVTVDVTGEIELLIESANAKSAEAIAQKIADNCFVDGKAWKHKHLRDVSESLWFQVIGDAEPEDE